MLLEEGIKRGREGPFLLRGPEQCNTFERAVTQHAAGYTLPSYLSLPFHSVQQSCRTESLHAGAKNPATGLPWHIEASGVWCAPSSLSYSPAASVHSFPHLGPSAPASRDSLPSIPDILESPVSTLAHVTPVANQGPQIWLFSAQLYVAALLTPIKILPILGDYRWFKKKYFLHFPQWTHSTYLKIEGKKLHVAKRIHSTLQNS